MKLLTVCIPCHNALETMHKSISSCLLMKDELDVLIIDCDSTDETYQIALEYQKEYPETIRVLHIEKHQSYIDMALEHSQGLYFKLLEPGDYFDQPSLVSVVETLRDIIRIQANLDLLITNYKVAIPEKKEKTYSYGKHFPTDTLFGWHALKHMRQDTVIHRSVMIFKTSTIKNVARHLDSQHDHYQLWEYLALTEVKSMYYLNMPFYCFVDEPYHQRQYECQYECDQLLKLFCAIDIYSLKSRKQRHYLINYLSILFVITMAHLIIDQENSLKIQLWKDMALHDPKLFKAIYNHLPGSRLGLDTKLGTAMLLKNYNLLKAKFHV